MVVDTSGSYDLEQPAHIHKSGLMKPQSQKESVKGMSFKQEAPKHTKALLFKASVTSEPRTLPGAGGMPPTPAPSSLSDPKV